MTTNAGTAGVLDYLIVGHVTKDLTPTGPVLGGTAAYAGLTASALGMRTYVATSSGPDLNLGQLASLNVFSTPAATSTVFENVHQAGRRRQTVHSRAVPLSVDQVPKAWRTASIVHLGPVAQEVDPLLADALSCSLLGVTPQGWMRTWDESGNVGPCIWSDETSLLQSAQVTVLSLEDIGGDEDVIARMASRSRLLVVTQAPDGARVYWRGQRKDFPAPQVDEVDSTGSGDIFAACYFVRLLQTRDPWEAARFANQLAAASVTRVGLASVPTAREIEAALACRDL